MESERIIVNVVFLVLFFSMVKVKFLLLVQLRLLKPLLVMKSLTILSPQIDGLFMAIGLEKWKT